MINQKQIVVTTAVFVGITAGIHVLLGLYGISEWLMTGNLSNILAPLFLLSGVAILIGMLGVYQGELAPQPTYVLGVIVMVIYLIGYADWHILGYTETLLGLEDGGHNPDSTGHDHDNHDHGDHDHSRDDSALVSIFNHLRTDLVALVSKTSEVISVTLLTALMITRR